jgi:hypothetical protein
MEEHAVQYSNFVKSDSAFTQHAHEVIASQHKRLKSLRIDTDAVEDVILRVLV